MMAFSVGSVPTCDLSLHGLTLREREAMMTADDWGLLIDRELWEHMTPTERERAKAEWTARRGHTGSNGESQ